MWEPGIYVNMTTCLKLTDENVADVKAELFDIPFKARESNDSNNVKS